MTEPGPGTTAEGELRLTYLVHAPGAEIAARADALLLEQAVELPRTALRDAEVMERVLGRVEGVRPEGNERYRVTIAHPIAATASEPAQLLNLVFGNSSLQPDVALADVELPASAFAWLPGPRVGISGLRAVAGVTGRPLLATVLKPMGLSASRLGTLCRGFARAGLDLVKDDHGLADHPFCPFEARVEACLRGVEDAARDTGRPAIYAPNLMGTPGRVVQQLEFARKAGVRVVLLSPMIVGLPLLHQLASMSGGVAIMAHPSLGGLRRIAQSTLFGKLFRWFGADASIFPHAGGRFTYDERTCRELAAVLREPHPRIKPAFPVPGGGITVERVPELLAFYGPDCILLIGSSLYLDGETMFERARVLVDRVARVSREPAA